jgi:hypothetical protein
VKHLKTDKHSKLSGEATKMPATMFGAYCAEQARMKQDQKEAGNSLKKNWDNDDFANQGLDITAWNDAKSGIKWIFQVWLEDWEILLQAKQDTVNEAKLLKKYSVLVWVDPDHGGTFMASKEKMHWSSMHLTCSYCLKLLMEAYNPSNPPSDHDWEPWVLEPKILHCLIVEYYENTPQMIC